MASFSSGKESLGQWRAYGNFRIGFKAKDLVKRQFNLYKCIYSKKEIKEWILKKSAIKEWNGDSLDDEAKRAAAFNLIYAAPKKYKNKHFEEEREVRLVVISHYSRGFYPACLNDRQAKNKGEGSKENYDNKTFKSYCHCWY
jgi:hypothetical protein